MAENINLDVSQVLTVIANLRDKNPEAAVRTMDVLRLILNREGYLPSDVQQAIAPLTAAVQSLVAQQQTNQQKIGELMAKIDEQSAATTAQIEELRAQSQKSFGEIRKALDDALASQITPEELAAAVEEAKAAQKLESQAEFDAAVDAAFAPIQAKTAEAKAAIQVLDDIVPDAPVEPTPTPGEPV